MIQLYAHRGGRNWGPENTMCVFQKSLELGVYGIELDVQRCKSGELVVFHDEYLSRTTNGAGLLRDSTFDELRRLSAGSWFSEQFKSEKIPLLEEVLELVSGNCVLNVEVKNLPYKYEGIEEELIETMDKYEAIDKVVFSSFDHEVISTMVKHRPDWHYASLMVGIPQDLTGYLDSLGAKYWNPEHKSLHRQAAELANSHGIQILAWTANKERDWARLIDLKVKGIITDEPDQLDKFLSQIG